MDALTSSSAPSSRARLGWLAFVLLACGHFTVLYLWRSPQFLNLPLYAHGGERLPYQTRALMAWLLGATAANSHLAPLLLRLSSPLPKEFHNSYAVVLLTVTFLTMFVAILAARASLLYLTGDRRFASWASLLTIYLTYFNLVAVYGLSYLLIFRNIPDDLKTARLLTILLLALGGYFVLLNVMAMRKIYIAIDSIEMVCGFYLLYQLNAAMRLERVTVR